MKRLTYDEWDQWRSDGITGSEAPIIMNASPWATPHDLFMRRTNRMPPQEVTYPMRRGIKLEPVARAEYEKVVGAEMPARCLTSEKWPIARASFDALNEEIEHAAEFKCPGKDDHMLALSGVIPEKYVWQLVHQLMVCNYDTIRYVSYHPDFPKQYQLACIVFVRNRDMETALLDAEKKFWLCLQTDTPPEGPKKTAVDRPSTASVIFPTQSRALIPPRGSRPSTPKPPAAPKPPARPKSGRAARFSNVHMFPIRSK